MSKLKPPLLLLATFSVFLLIWYFLDLPPEDELREIIISFLGTYGPIVILLGAFFEGLLGVGLYFPGSTLIFVSVALAPNPIEAAKATILATLGLYAGYVVDYLLGRYGWYHLIVRLGMSEGINRAKERLETQKEKYFFLTFWGPGLAVLTSTAAGILQLPFMKFAVLAFTALALWNLFWGSLVYILGEAALTLVGYKFVLSILAAWLLYELVKAYTSKKKNDYIEPKV